MIVDELIAGDTLDFTDVVPDFPHADGWTLKYRLVPQFATPTQAPITLTATPYGSDYRIQATASATAAWLPGQYSWSRWVEKSGPIRQTVGAGQIKILTDPASAAQGYDNRPHARKVLEAIEAVIENRATKDQEEYTIEGRSLKRTPIADLLVLRDKYLGAAQSADAATALASGLPNPRRVGVRFQRV
jgi:hypothetical protein